MLSLKLKLDCIEAGCDEAGRGCLAGPVVAAAVILPDDFKNDQLNDSKQLTEKQRYNLREIIQKEAISWAVSFVNHEEIDEINILQSSFLAMRRAVFGLSLKPEHLLIDGNRFKPISGIDHTCIIKGDAKFLSIAAASVMAKTYRDDFMLELDALYPEYGWKNNKGYPTMNHRKALDSLGASPFHRMTFNLVGNSQLKLFK
jgi:ribonuclease HII